LEKGCQEEEGGILYEAFEKVVLKVKEQREVNKGG
jgi:hypothetical protein